MLARVNAPQRLWVFARTRHVDLEGFAPAECREPVLGFLIETLRP